MSKRKSGEEPRVKSRRTRLSKLSNEELIAIILRKDKTERNNNAKIDSLLADNAELKHQCSEANVESLNLTISRLQEDNVKLSNGIENLKGFMDTANIHIARLSKKCNILQKAFWTSVTITILAIAACVWL